mmetsp:Transcript_23531/g.46805  ORF Transcript_23531/g.46805 Transcript_23531/m.46805 type:complete len:546 (+) Transcript_23531:51-1688(+)
MMLPLLGLVLMAVHGTRAMDSEEVYTSLYETSAVQFLDAPGHVQGSVPSYLRGGKLIRNGCGRFEMGKHSFSHVFDCFSKLHSWDFRDDGSVLVSAKFLTSNFFNKSTEMDDLWPSIYFGVESPRFDLAKRTAAMKNSMPSSDANTFDNLNVNLFNLGRRSPTGGASVTALTDGLTFRAVDVESLDATFTQFENLNAADNGTMSSAHPKHVPGTRTTVNYYLSNDSMLKEKAKLHIYKQEFGSDTVDVFFETEIDFTPYMHSISVTPNYAIVALYPCHFKEMCVMKSMERSWTGVSGCFEWDGSSNSTKILVVDMNSGKLATRAEVPAFFSLHHANAYESGDGVVLDLNGWDDSTILHQAVFEKDVLLDVDARNAFKSDFIPPFFRRYEISLQGEETVITDLPTVDADTGVDYPFDFPLVNPLFAGVNYCIVWGQNSPFGGGSDSYSAGTWVKNNICTGSVTPLSFPPTAFPTGDALFVPDPSSDDEDGGVLLVCFRDGTDGSTFLSVVDAKGMQEVARVRGADGEDFSMPYAFHGVWVPKEERE